MRTPLTPHAIICLDGTLPSSAFFSKQTDATIIAADGAAWNLHSQGIQPHIIIGDLDSFSKKEHTGEFAGAEIIQNSDQETNDFEKAFLYCYDKGFMNLCIVGIHGGDLEHTLNNWSVLTRYSYVFSLFAFDNNRYVVPVTDRLQLQTTIGETISLIPQPSVVCSTEGLQWELHNEELAMGVREGARNKAINTTVTISVHEGAVLVCYAAE